MVLWVWPANAAANATFVAATAVGAAGGIMLSEAFKDAGSSEGSSGGSKSSSANNTVYQALDEEGNVIYVGITNNFIRRAGEQLRLKDITIRQIDGLVGLVRSDARAAEQALIESFGLSKNGGSLINQINSIARSNPSFSAAFQRGNDLLRQAGYTGLK